MKKKIRKRPTRLDINIDAATKRLFVLKAKKAGLTQSQLLRLMVKSVT